MKTSFRFSYLPTPKPVLYSIISGNLVFGLLLATAVTVSPAEFGKAFATPEEAVSALTVAVTAVNSNALYTIFGPTMADLENPDRIQAANDLTTFASALNQTNRIVPQSDSKYVLEVGNDFWPFAVPIVKQNGKWFFDTEAGMDELLSRRIGKNELATLKSVRTYVDAQRQYAAKDRDGDEVLEYAQKFASSPGKKDGLYWPLDLDGEMSPLGPLIAEGQTQGYGRNIGKEGATPQPFHGYYYKILTRQGKSAPLGKYDYIINGKMIAGFALVAWPAEYGQSGIMTFIVNQQGRVYQKNLGEKTAKIASKMKEYDPDSTWQICPN